MELIQTHVVKAYNFSGAYSNPCCKGFCKQQAGNSRFAMSIQSEAYSILDFCNGI